MIFFNQTFIFQKFNFLLMLLLICDIYLWKTLFWHEKIWWKKNINGLNTIVSSSEHFLTITYSPICLLHLYWGFKNAFNYYFFICYLHENGQCTISFTAVMMNMYVITQFEGTLNDWLEVRNIFFYNLNCLWYVNRLSNLIFYY